MKKYDLRPKYTRRIRNKTYKRIEENVQPNIVNRQFNTNKRNQIWCTDVTYLIYKSKRMYLSTIIDLYDRRVVSYVISKFNNNKLVMDTVIEAFKKEKKRIWIDHSQ